MFYVNIRAMEGAAEALQEMLKKMDQAIAEAEAVGCILTRTEGMEELSLFRETESLWEERDRLSALSAALWQAASCYRSGEQDIVNAVTDISSASEARPASVIPSASEARPASVISSEVKVRPASVISSEVKVRPASVTPSASEARPASAIPSEVKVRPASVISAASETRPTRDSRSAVTRGIGLVHNIFERRRQRRKEGQDGGQN